jgi:hypothetical protein
VTSPVAAVAPANESGSLLHRLNTRWHERALWIFMAIVVLHWVEHLVQAYQIWVLHHARPDSRGFLGQLFPWLVTSEALHFGFAVVMFAGLLLLRPGFKGQARTWWTAALLIQTWHLVEHTLLQIQSATGTFFFGGTVPTSVAQIWIPRVELHLFYNAVVFIPMVVAMWLHTRPAQADQLDCTCALAHAS